MTDLEKLREDIRSTLSIHVDNRADVPAILKLIMLSIRERLLNETRTTNDKAG